VTHLNPTPPSQLVDGQDRPYFLWDTDLTLDQFRARLNDPDPDVRAYFVAKLMRQAKPDDVFTFITVAKIREHWSHVLPYLGNTRAFWQWLLAEWDRPGDEDQ